MDNATILQGDAHRQLWWFTSYCSAQSRPVWKSRLCLKTFDGVFAENLVWIMFAEIILREILRIVVIMYRKFLRIVVGYRFLSARSSTPTQRRWRE